MNAPLPHTPLLAAFDAEWQRLDFLVWCLSRNRQGDAPGDKEITRLRELQAEVDSLRAPDGAWETLLGFALSHIEYDILSCTLGPEIEPRLGWAFQNLQAGVAQPWATRSLIQELLALDPSQAESLRRALAPESPLRRRQLVRGGTDPLQGLVFTDFRQLDARYTTWFTKQAANLDGVITVALKKRREARARSLDELGDATDSFEIAENGGPGRTVTLTRSGAGDLGVSEEMATAPPPQPRR